MGDSVLRLGVFLGVLGAMMLAEAIAPRRGRLVSRARRWPSNIGVAAIGTLAARLLLPLSTMGMALLAEERGWGLFNAGVLPSRWVAIPLAVIVLDLAIYLQHVGFHAIPLLWRLHRMHHADLDVDATTGTRFHPAEILLSTIVKVSVVAALGAPPAAVLLFELLLNATSVFNHANLRLPLALDRALRFCLVTPDMHRVHHSIDPEETNRNFGFLVPWWDRLAGTYLAQPRAGHEAMTLGIEQFRSPADLRLDRMLVQPLLREPGRYPLGARRPAG